MEQIPSYTYESSSDDQEEQTQRFVWRLAAIMLLLHTLVSVAMGLALQTQFSGQQWYYQAINLLLVFGLLAQKRWAYPWTLLRTALETIVFVVQFATNDLDETALLDAVLFAMIFVALIGKPNRMRAIFSAAVFMLLLGGLMVYMEVSGINPLTNPGLVHVVEGWQHLEEDDPAAAVESYLAAVERQPDLMSAHHGLASAYYRLDRYEEALAAFDTALELETGSDVLWSNRALALMELGRYAECVPDMDRAIALSPDEADHHDTRAECLYALERYDEALAAASRAIQLDPDNPMFYVNRGWIYLDTGDFTRAKLDWEDAVRRLPADDPAVFLIQEWIQELDEAAP